MREETQRVDLTVPHRFSWKSMYRKPAACFEIFTAPGAAIFTVCLQILSMILTIAIYFILEADGYFRTSELFRMVLIPIAILYISGAILAAYGIIARQKLLLTIHSTITISVMIITDILAVSIILLMAIGKRNTYLNHLPALFVNDRKFYDILGPFWMYLGAISLHITVAVNMAFLQPLNDFLSFMQKESEMTKAVIRETYVNSAKKN